MRRLPHPRLLPVTMSTMALLLVVKSGMLAMAALTDGRHADTQVVTVANAADHGAAAEKKPASAHNPPLAPPPSDAPPADALPKAMPPPAISESEKALLQDLRQRRKDLESREATLSAREAVLTASERKLDSRVTELQTLRKSLEDLEAARAQKQEAGWQGLVKVYEAMKPRDAATIFNDLQMPVLLQVLDRMKDAKAAGILAAMSPDKAREVTADLAQLRLSRTEPRVQAGAAGSQGGSGSQGASGSQGGAGSGAGTPPPPAAPGSPKSKAPSQAAATRANPAGG